jgi:hypothetical protein
MGWFQDFVSNPVGTVSNTVSDFVQSPSQSVGQLWNTGGKTAAELAALAYGGEALLGGMGGAAGAGGNAAALTAAGMSGAASTGTAAGAGSLGSAFAGLNTGGFGTALNIASAINSLTGGGLTGALGLGTKSPTAAEATSAADPFAQYRSGLAAQYAGALQPGGTTNIQGMPGYTQYNTGVMQPALQATQRAGAATGQLYSGGEAAALQKQAQQGYYGFMTDYLNRLATGSGASVSPLGGAAAGTAAGNLNAQGVQQGLSGLGTAVSGLGGIFGNAINYGTMLSNNAAMSATPNYLQAAGQLSTPNMSGFNPLDYRGG